jgi:ABC-type multidrug transport system ATPase subunit
VLLRVENLTKSLGPVQLLRGVSFGLPKGSVMALLGTHSVSKTSLVRLIAGLSKITSGRILVQGRSVTEAEARMHIGYMPRNFGVYPRTSVEEFLEFFAAAYHVPLGARLGVIGDVLRLVDLWEKRDASASSLDEDERLRLAFGRILLHNPDLLLLDEPLDAFGVEGLDQFEAVVRELRSMGKSVLFTCVDPGVLGEFADLVAVLHTGRLVDFGPAAEVLDRVARFGWPPPPPPVPQAWAFRPPDMPAPGPYEPVRQDMAPPPAAPSSHVEAHPPTAPTLPAAQVAGTDSDARGSGIRQTLHRADGSRPVRGTWKPAESSTGSKAEAKDESTGPAPGPAPKEKEDPAGPESENSQGET